MLHRNIQNDLINWKESQNRLPLVLKGARQVGKSFALELFGKKSFKNYYLINFQKEEGLKSIFDGDLDPKSILSSIKLRKSIDINPKTDLLILDEIQDCPRAYTSLKYFAESMPELAVASAGSYLGLMAKQPSAPVGKVDYLFMNPLTFEEFLQAIDQEAYEIFSKLQLQEGNCAPIQPTVHEHFLELLKSYFIIGGLPQVVSRFKGLFKDDIADAYSLARKTQLNLIEGYKADFAKHAGLVKASHILSVFEAIPQQLSVAVNEEVKKFKFSNVIPKQKGFDRIIGPLTWLEKSRLVIKSLIVNKAEHPLRGYCRDNFFKAYMFDVGILHAMLQVPVSAIWEEKLGSYKGYLAENFVSQERFARENSDLYAWKEGNSEVEFLVLREANIYPLEVKSSKKSRAAKSLDTFISKYSPAAAYKATGQNMGFNKKRKMTTLPIYLVSKL